MPAIYVDTMEQWLAVRPTLAPVYVNSKRYGRVLIPCANTVLVSRALVVRNTYNPNHVSADKMAELRESIMDNGFCFPVVVIWDDDQQLFVIIDGFHRNVISGVEWLDLDYIPIVVLNHDITRRMIATKQFNDARGKHQVDMDAEMIRMLSEQGLSDDVIATKLGMQPETVYRYKQHTGVAALFANVTYSPSWSMVEPDDTDPKATP